MLWPGFTVIVMELDCVSETDCVDDVVVLVLTVVDSWRDALTPNEATSLIPPSRDAPTLIEDVLLTPLVVDDVVEAVASAVNDNVSVRGTPSLGTKMVT